MVYRIFVEKKKDQALEAAALLNDARSFLGIESLRGVRILNRYDAENISEELFDYTVKTIFSEPQLDIVSKDPDLSGSAVFAVEYLPGQFDQRADSAAQCIQVISQKERPLIRSAKVYVLDGDISKEELEEIKKYVINPVEARQASLEKPDTIKTTYEIPSEVVTLEGFLDLDKDGLKDFIDKYSLAMDEDDIAFCREYFRSENRPPTITEIRLIDTYWSDHCRHTTFGTIIDDIEFEDPLLKKSYKSYLSVRRKLNRDKPICLMDIATIAANYLKANGYLDKLDESKEVNACTVKIEITANGRREPWLLLFKNETHNHPTEIEPFGGAATCIGGAIRDPLSGRAYVYGAMRLTGAADPTVPVSETIPGKLPQRKLVSTAAAGYSSYGNQIGLATGIVDELYHPGYAAKHMEIGAVIGAVPEENVRREEPAPGDIVILLGGATGRDGIGGATGSSKAHDSHSVETCGAEVQKGNAPEERKLQRLFRNKKAARMIKRCNDFGAGGVSVAIGELADGLEINLNEIPKKYEGLDGTELAISESQERMAVVVDPKNVDAFLMLAEEENLDACPVAFVRKEPRLVMYWNGRKIVDLSREFLNSNGAEKHIVVKPQEYSFNKYHLEGVIDPAKGFVKRYKTLMSDLNVCSKRGLSERFDSTIGAGTVLMPFGGKYQLTPVQAMVQKICTEKKHTDDCSLMSWGFNPFITEQSPFHGAYLAVVESVCKLIASGAEFKDVYLTLQEYFNKPGKDGQRWSAPLCALLGAFKAQMDLKIGAIGGKDSMSGTFETLDVPPTLVSFAVTTSKVQNIVSPEFKSAGNKVILLAPSYGKNKLPKTASLLEVFAAVTDLLRKKTAVSAYTPGMGGIAEAIAKMAFGNGFGFKYDEGAKPKTIFKYSYGSFLLEVDKDAEIQGAKLIGEITDDGLISRKEKSVSLKDLLDVYEAKLESVYPCNIADDHSDTETFSYEAKTRPAPALRSFRPRVLIPAFPGTNCEYDSAKAMADAGADPRIIVINNLTSYGISESADRFARELRSSQMIFIPGGFSLGDEPDGSGKFITAFFRNDQIKEYVTELLDERGGLILGICNGFQALIKLGLLPYGKIIDTDENSPTLTFNTIARHQSRIVRTRIASNMSPWLSLTQVGEVYNIPISHGEGRFFADGELIKSLAKNGQIATQYVDLGGCASTDIRFNPNNSMYAVEGITSPDGRVFGRMGHAERFCAGLYKNVPGNYDFRMFEAAAKYFRKQ